MHSRYKHKIEALPQNDGYRGKAISITYSDWMCVALRVVIQRAKRMRHITL